jgi:hypothetical protein
VAWEKILTAPTVVPLLAELPKFLDHNLEPKVLVPEGMSIPPARRVEASFQHALQPLSLDGYGEVWELLFKPIRTKGTTENEFNWELTVDNVFSILGRTHNLRIEIKRNGVLSETVTPSPRPTFSGSSNKRRKIARCDERPDMSAVFDGVLIFILEEKVDKLGLAEDDIRDKIVWNRVTHGEDLPYLLGMAAAGTRAQFHAISPGSSPNRVQSISGVFDIANTEQRFLFVRALINVARLCVALRAQVGERGPINHMATYSNGSIVTLSKNGVLKFVAASKDKANKDVSKDKDKSMIRDRHVKLSDLKALYLPEGQTNGSILNNIPNCVHVEDAEINEVDAYMLLTLKPRGFTWNMRERALAVRALRDTALALEALHEKGWVHRDVRWPNIVQMKDGEMEDDGGFMLIDFEYAARKGSKVTWHNDKHQPEEARASKKTSQMGWQPKHDVWQLGMLLAEVDEEGELKELTKQLTDLSRGATAKLAVAALEAEINRMQQRQQASDE